MSRKTSNRRPKKAKQRVVIDGPSRTKRPVRKTIHFTEEHAYRLSVLAAMSALNSRELSQSGIIEDALEAWFEANEMPSEFAVKLDAA